MPAAEIKPVPFYLYCGLGFNSNDLCSLSQVMFSFQDPGETSARLGFHLQIVKNADRPGTLLLEGGQYLSGHESIPLFGTKNAKR